MPNTIAVKDKDGLIVVLETWGTPITGQSLEAGGASGQGWLSSLRKAITDRLPAALGGNGGLKVEIISGGGESGSSNLFCNQNTSVTTTAAALGSQACREVLLQALPTNSADLLVGSSSAQFMRLVPGASLPVACTNINLVFVKSVSGTQTVNWLARS